MNRYIGYDYSLGLRYDTHETAVKRHPMSSNKGMNRRKARYRSYSISPVRSADPTICPGYSSKRSQFPKAPKASSEQYS